MRNAITQAQLITAGCGVLILACSGCGPRIDGLAPVTERGQDVANLFYLSLILSLGIFLLVAGLSTFIMIRFRGKPGEADPPQVSGNRRLEIIWTATPTLLLAGLFALTLQTMITITRPEPSPLRIQVIGHQWWWEFRYPELGVVTANELHVPVGRPLQLEITAADVIHSFWVPRFGWKMDAIPQKINLMRLRVNQAGTVDGTCTEYCGTQHAWMRILVVAEPPSQFESWVGQQRQRAPSPAAPAAIQGQQIFLQNTCVNCHTISGTPAQGQVGPVLTHLRSRETLGAGVLENTPENLARYINHIQEVKPGALMPGYNFSDPELAALVTYLERLK
jgi:cytochrome c oxidase subunit 2